MIAYGEENRDWGGAFAVYRGLTEALPYHRLFNAPIAEGAIVGSAVGYALEGGRALVELMYCDFMGRAGDETLQPALQVAVDERRSAQNAGGRARLGGQQVRRPAQPGLDELDRRPHPGAEGRVPGDALRRQGPDVQRLAREPTR